MYARFGTRQILIGLETVELTDPVLTGLLNAYMTFEADMSIEVDTATRTPDLPWFAADEKIEVGTRIKASFKADCVGAATAGNATPTSAVDQICGLAEVLTAGVKTNQNTITNGIPSGAFYFYQGGLRVKCTGARGGWEVSRAPNSFGEKMYTVTGIVADETNVFTQTAIPTIDTTAFRSGPVITPGNWSVVVNGINVECLKNDIKSSVDPAQYIPTSESGRVLYTARKMDACVLSILLPDLSVINPWALATARTRFALVDTVDGGATLKSKITMPAVQFYKPKKFTNIKDGVQIDIPYCAHPTSAGNDEVQFEFN